jgi:hypothetical protein
VDRGAVAALAGNSITIACGKYSVVEVAGTNVFVIDTNGGERTANPLRAARLKEFILNGI